MLEEGDASSSSSSSSATAAATATTKPPSTNVPQPSLQLRQLHCGMWEALRQAVGLTAAQGTGH